MNEGYSKALVETAWRNLFPVGQVLPQTEYIISQSPPNTLPFDRGGVIIRTSLDRCTTLPPLSRHLTYRGEMYQTVFFPAERHIDSESIPVLESLEDFLFLKPEILYLPDNRVCYNMELWDIHGGVNINKSILIILHKIISVASTIGNLEEIIKITKENGGHYKTAFTGQINLPPGVV